MNNIDQHQSRADSPNAEAPSTTNLAPSEQEPAVSPQLSTNASDKSTVIVYLRSATSGSTDAIDRQREITQRYVDNAGLSVDETVVAFGSGTKVNDQLEAILLRAQSGEKIVLVMSDTSRVAKDVDAASKFVVRALGCGMRLVMGELELTDCLSSIMVWRMYQSMAKAMRPRRPTRNVARRSPAS